mgnify:CR=1 FL=1|tara:strand:- start:225 stop:380 length:156 start_codon:yes stop_codon:yes gene_type:complete
MEPIDGGDMRKIYIALFVGVFLVGYNSLVFGGDQINLDTGEYLMDMGGGDQ